MVAARAIGSPEGAIATYRRGEGWLTNAQPVTALVARGQPMEYVASRKPWSEQGGKCARPTMWSGVPDVATSRGVQRVA